MWKAVRLRLHRIQYRLQYLAQRCRQLSALDTLVLLQACFWVGVVRLSLYLIPFAWCRMALERLHRIKAFQVTGSPVKRHQITWSVSAAGRRIPKATCLTQALAARILLNRYGYSNQLCIGVRIEEEGTFSAHAWLEGQEGRVLIGQLSTLSCYTKLPLESANVMF